ncbi:MAG: gamma-glutamyl-gamma-aminobutyrate hydrolase family protein [Verrucomicrobiales bacterium]|nr:gamma-glutamyl-gamma-aminobutyrate hydrolase family protein [Verrucomicrobiales bacterium]
MTRRWLFGLLALLVAGGLGFQAGRLAPEVSRPDEGGERRPLIGIASLDSPTYIRAVQQCGGVPVVLPDTEASPEAIEEYLERLDGLILPGGADIPPAEYGESAHETVKVLDDNRFHFEKALGQAWITQTQKPLLGVCLGSQWINVLCGGSLVQDIPSEFGVNHRDTGHRVTLAPDSRLRRILGVEQLEVNSFHHQAVRRLGEGLRVVAESGEGVVEATEGTDPSRFLIGVQWHPEKMMPEDSRQTRLIQAFVDAAKERLPVP